MNTAQGDDRNGRAVSLSTIIAGATEVVVRRLIAATDVDPQVSGVAFDSRDVETGSLFFCVRVLDHDLDDVSVDRQLVVDDERDSTCGNGRCGEMVPVVVLATHAEEE